MHPNILNAPQCDETKCVFLSGTKALKKHSVTLILKCCEDKKKFSIFFLRKLKSYTAFKWWGYPLKQGKGGLRGGMVESLKKYGYLKNASSKDDFYIELDKKGF